jgi:DinB family protein
MTPEPLAEVLARLATMPAFLEHMAGRFPGDTARRPGPGGAFSFLQNVWHLADLEREGYAERIARLRGEERPELADFDGARVARERDYQNLPLGEGLAAFAAARRATLAALAAVGEGEWARGGVQAGVGPVTLADVPSMMAEHDASHRDEIRGLLGEPVHGAGARASR